MPKEEIMPITVLQLDKKREGMNTLTSRMSNIGQMVPSWQTSATGAKQLTQLQCIDLNGNVLWTLNIAWNPDGTMGPITRTNPSNEA
jgi:hypothetical protein